jgi:hypothetical protein
VTLVLAGFVALGLPLTRGPVLGALVGLLLAAALAASRAGPAARAEPPAPPRGPLERLALAASVGLCSLSVLVDAVDGSRFAITVADEATHYFAKSCEIFDLGRFGAGYAKALARAASRHRTTRC